MPSERRDTVSLFCISFLALFYELVFIRWLPANVLSIAYFSNVVLISCFLGFGLGCLQTRRRDWFAGFPALLAVVAGAFLSLRRFEVLVAAGGGEWIWSHYRGNVVAKPLLEVGILPALAIVFALTAILFVPIGQKMGRLMETMPPNRAYSVNLLGSLAGVAAFGGLAFLGAGINSPTVWFAVGAAVTLWFFRGGRAALLYALGAGIVVCGMVWLSSEGEIWSPYYNILTEDEPDGSVRIYVNRFFHQRMIAFASQEHARRKYAIPYGLKKPQRLLILGAGTGNDVAVALAQGVPDIDAVEIDPAIVELGRRRNPQHVYDDPRVHVIVDDARSFLRRSEKQYDMVIFGTLDSHALLSGMSTVRLDNFVYTLESLQDVRRRLTDDGVVVLLFSVPRDWIGRKLLAMCLEVFRTPAPIAYEGDGELFNLLVVAGPGLKACREQGRIDPRLFASVAGDFESIELPTDDWPYLYLEGRSIPGHYLQGIAVLLGLSLLGLWLSLPKGGLRLDANFFSLGCAFLLLETKSVTTLSLLFGSTWLVNAFVFAAILVMILLANVLSARIAVRRAGVLYALLIGTLLLNYAVPAGAFLALGFWSRSLLSCGLLALPLFFAGLVFAHHFRSAPDTAAVYGANLMGAVLGGFLEYGSMLLGLNPLYLIAVLFYLFSYLVARRDGAS